MKETAFDKFTEELTAKIGYTPILRPCDPSNGYDYREFNSKTNRTTQMMMKSPVWRAIAKGGFVTVSVSQVGGKVTFRAYLEFDRKNGLNGCELLHTNSYKTR